MEHVTFILSKLFWAMLRPDSWIILGLILSYIAVWVKRYRLTRFLLSVTAVIVLIIAIFPVGDVLRAPLEREFPQQTASDAIDGIVLLGGSASVDLSSEWNQVQLNESAERLTAGLALARRFPDAKIIFTGGNAELLKGKEFSTEAGIAEAFFAEQGLDPERITFERKARNTYENAIFSYDLANPSRDERWILVTSAYHMPRAMATFRKAGWETIVAYPVDYRSLPFWQGVEWDFSGHLEALNVAVKEYVGLIAYRYLGYAE